ncbi:MAG: hypothetical protein M3Q15_00895 [Pseudomonadota bacterium]|nr:hypothetical protein [Pseudomonadota bacterium]
MLKSKTGALAPLMLAGLLVLGACDDGATPQNVTSIAVTDSGNSLARLRALDPQNRDLALRRAIHDAGETCKRIESAGEQEAYQDLAMFWARCEGGLDWAIFIAPAGDIQVRSCGSTQQLGLPGCRLSG